VDWLDAERANLLAAVRQAADTPGVPAALGVQLAHALFGYFTVRGHWQDWVQVNQTALGIARRLGDRAAQAQAHNDLGLGHSHQGRFGEALACHQQSLAIRRELGDQQGQAASLGNLGNLHTWQGRHDQALACLRESLAIYRQLGAPLGQADSLRELGSVLRALGREEDARAHLRQALALFEELQTADATRSVPCSPSSSPPARCAL
jgi:tetratricopeptide (TPR) repeat protein